MELTALGSPAIRIEATVDPGLRHVRGHMVLSDLADATLLDPLVDLEVPPHELTSLRTYPGVPNQGKVWFWRVDDQVRFVAHLPHRYGDLGSTVRGLFANGAWYPQPFVDGQVPTVAWDVRLSLPEGTVGAVGDTAGAGELHWRGEAERVAIGVLPRGTVTRIEGETFTADVVHRRKRPRRPLRRHLAGQLPLVAVEGARWSGALIEVPGRRRLVRPGPGLAFVSDRAWRVFPWFQRIHHEAALRGITEAWMPSSDPWTRAIAAASLSTVHAGRLKRDQAISLVGLTKWVTVVDRALFDQEMAFRQELFKRAHPSDRLRDDLMERLSPRAAGTVVAAQLGDRHGADALVAVGRDVAMGWPLDDALARAGIPVAELDPYRQPYPSQDYRIHLAEHGIVIDRDAPERALPEPVVVSVDGERHLLEAPAGPGRLELPLDTAPQRVVLDPDGHLGQTSRVGEVRPPPLRWTLSGQISGINVSQGIVSAFGTLAIRRADDTKNLFIGSVSTGQRNRLQTRLTYYRFFGAVRRGTVRRNALSFSVENTWLNPNFAELIGPPYAVGGSLGYSWDNRVYSIFPTRGGRVSGSVGAGYSPATAQPWFRASLGGTVLGKLHPRVVWGQHAWTGLALTNLPHRLWDLGGFGAVGGLPSGQIVQNRVIAVAKGELRWVPFRNVDVPLGVMHAADLQLTVGADAGLGVSAEGDQVSAVGLSASAGVTVEYLGISPATAFVLFGYPAWTQGIDLPRRRVQVSIGWSQSF